MPSPANHSAGPEHKESLRLVLAHVATKGLQANILPPEERCEGYLCDLSALTVMGALASPWIGLKTLDGSAININGRLNLVISTQNETRVLGGLAQLLEPVKTNQRKRFEALSDIDREAHLKNIQQLRNQYRSYLRTERLAVSQFPSMNRATRKCFA